MRANGSLVIEAAELGKEWAPLVSQYQHLGSKISAQAQMMPELVYRRAEAWSAIRPIAKTVLRNSTFPVPLRLNTGRMLFVYSALSYRDKQGNDHADISANRGNMAARAGTVGLANYYKERQDKYIKLAQGACDIILRV